MDLGVAVFVPLNVKSYISIRGRFASKLKYDPENQDETPSGSEIVASDNFRGQLEAESCWTRICEKCSKSMKSLITKITDKTSKIIKK